jgi:hypothetical protein
MENRSIVSKKKSGRFIIDPKSIQSWWQIDEKTYADLKYALRRVQPTLL